jgi:membrane-associated phospholipid phosphatase
MMKFLTDFGDSAVLLPLSAVVLIWLLATRSVSAAIWWVGVLAVFGAVIGGLKMLFFACPPAVDVRSPSGHTGFSMLVYGGIAVIIAAQRRSLWSRAGIMLATIALVVGIAISRVTLHMHSRTETLIGFLIGAAAVAVFVFGYRRTTTNGRLMAPLLFAVVLTAALFHGARLNAETNLHTLGGWLDLQQLFCR